MNETIITLPRLAARFDAGIELASQAVESTPVLVRGRALSLASETFLTGFLSELKSKSVPRVKFQGVSGGTFSEIAVLARGLDLNISRV